MAKIIRETDIDVVKGKIKCLKLVVQTAMTMVGTGQSNTSYKQQSYREIQVKMKLGSMQIHFYDLSINLGDTVKEGKREHWSILRGE
jgi:hypothetical protein